MKKFFITAIAIFLISFLITQASFAQCSICAKSVQQMGAKPAEGFNHGILYLMLVPYGVIGVVGFKWWKNNRQNIRFYIVDKFIQKAKNNPVKFLIPHNQVKHIFLRIDIN